MPASGRAGSVTIFLREASAGAPRDRTLLADAVAAAAGVAPESVWLETACARCGSTEHGKPVVRAPVGSGGGRIQVSLSRAGGLVGVAVLCAEAGEVADGQAACFPAGIGLDLTSIADVARASIDAALHPSELAALRTLPEARRTERRALLWTAKEAVLKAAGVGLNTDPALLELRVGPDDTIALIGAPPLFAVEAPPRITAFNLPGGLVGALATLGEGADGIRFVRLTPALTPTDGAS